MLGLRLSAESGENVPLGCDGNDDDDKGLGEGVKE